MITMTIKEYLDINMNQGVVALFLLAIYYPDISD